MLQRMLRIFPNNSVPILLGDGYRDVFDWARADAPGCVLRLHSESAGNYKWAFDRETRAPNGVTVLDSLWSGTAGWVRTADLRIHNPAL